LVLFYLTVCPCDESSRVVQSIVISIAANEHPIAYAIVRRRQHDRRVGTASRGPVEGLCRFSPRVHHLVDRLYDVVAPYQHCLEIETSQRHVHHYLAGLLSHLERTKAEESAALVDVERLVMQECSGTAPWDHRLLVTVLVGQGVDRLGAPDEVLVFDPRSYPKRGVHSVGVKRP